jgi:pre-mRNA-splicing factor SYF2
LVSRNSDYDDYARRKYKKDIDSLKPDLVSYNKQRAAATGSGASDSSALVSASSSSVIQRAAAENLYRNMDSLVYADHRPTEEAVDRVVGKLNLECVPLSHVAHSGGILADILINFRSIDKRSKRSRVRKEEDGEITYINVSLNPASLPSWMEIFTERTHLFLF